jgi:hypothetical protein
MLYRLSYASILERETGVEPATNSLIVAQLMSPNAMGPSNGITAAVRPVPLGRSLPWNSVEEWPNCRQMTDSSAFIADAEPATSKTCSDGVRTLLPTPLAVPDVLQRC